MLKLGKSKASTQTFVSLIPLGTQHTGKRAYQFTDANFLVPFTRTRWCHSQELCLAWFEARLIQTVCYSIQKPVFYKGLLLIHRPLSVPLD